MRFKEKSIGKDKEECLMEIRFIRISVSSLDKMFVFVICEILLLLGWVFLLS